MNLLKRTELKNIIKKETSYIRVRTKTGITSYNTKYYEVTDKGILQTITGQYIKRIKG